jgi:hypothetical protein
MRFPDMPLAGNLVLVAQRWAWEAWWSTWSFSLVALPKALKGCFRLSPSSLCHSSEGLVKYTLFLVLPCPDPYQQLAVLWFLQALQVLHHDRFGFCFLFQAQMSDLLS